MQEQIAQKNWGASIYKRNINFTPAGILHVKGEVTTDPLMEASLEKKSYQGFQSKTLKLKVVTYHSNKPLKQPQLLHYPELLIHDQQYDSIKIYNENESIITITNIPVIL